MTDTARSAATTAKTLQNIGSHDLMLIKCRQERLSDIPNLMLHAMSEKTLVQAKHLLKTARADDPEWLLSSNGRRIDLIWSNLTKEKQRSSGAYVDRLRAIAKTATLSELTETKRHRIAEYIEKDSLERWEIERLESYLIEAGAL